jgi:hypothetical protein
MDESDIMEEVKMQEKELYKYKNYDNRKLW